MPVRKVSISLCNPSQILSPIVGRQRQLYRSEGQIRDLSEEFLFRFKVVQDGHRIDTDARSEFTQRKTALSREREHVKRRPQNIVAIQFAGTAGTKFWLVCRST